MSCVSIGTSFRSTPKSCQEKPKGFADFFTRSVPNRSSGLLGARVANPLVDFQPLLAEEKDVSLMLPPNGVYSPGAHALRREHRKVLPTGCSVSLIVPSVGAQEGDVVGPFYRQVLVIDGPPAPAPPAVVARDAEGRVTVRAARLREPLRLDGELREEVTARPPRFRTSFSRSLTKASPLRRRPKCSEGRCLPLPWTGRSVSKAR